MEAKDLGTEHYKTLKEIKDRINSTGGQPIFVDWKTQYR